MEARKSRVGLGIALGVLGVFVGVVTIGMIVAYTGAVNVGATEEHAALTRWAFDTTFRNSVKARAAQVPPPQTITPDMIRAGAKAYASSCQHCHAAPGVERTQWASGMRPQPPHLTEAASRWETREIFWLAKHGIKMTGMPAFGPTHDDAALWGVAAFVSELPGMTAERYKSLSGDSGHGGESPPPHHQKQ